jgi:hypothetical protein
MSINQSSASSKSHIYRASSFHTTSTHTTFTCLLLIHCSPYVLPAAPVECLYDVGLGWAGGSHVEFGMSSSLPLEPELAPCGWRCPHRRLTLMKPSNLPVMPLQISTLHYNLTGTCHHHYFKKSRLTDAVHITISNMIHHFGCTQSLSPYLHTAVAFLTYDTACGLGNGPMRYCK